MKNQEEYDLNQWGVAGKVIHTPGHTPGSLSVVLENGNAIIMDMVASGILMGGVMWHSRVKYPPFHDNLKDLKGSFENCCLKIAITFTWGTASRLPGISW